MCADVCADNLGVNSMNSPNTLSPNNSLCHRAEIVGKSRKSSFSSCYSNHSTSASSTTSSAMNQTTAPPPLLHEFYHGRSVFITGGTGFVGKVLIEKLLFEFRDIGRIFVLMRPKAGVQITTRVEQMIQSKAFDRIRQHCPEQFTKIVPIGGDISMQGLGINPLDLELVAANVTVIFHSAATIRFDEPLKYALKINTMGTKRALELAKRLKNLAAFIHVSTAYCGVNKRNIQERVYPESVSPDRVLQMASFMPDDTFDQMKEIFYQGRPCSYHYTKSLAEQLVAEQVQNGYVSNYCEARAESAARAFVQFETEHKSKLPLGSFTSKTMSQSDSDDEVNCECPEPEDSTSSTVTLNTHSEPSHRRKNLMNLRPFPAAIIRPSIITSAWREPFPGWVDNYNGTTGFMVVNGKGVLRSIHVQEHYVTDLIPVDVVINTCISSAWYIAACRHSSSSSLSSHHQRRDSCDSSGVSSNDGSEHPTDASTSEVFVVNCVSGARNPLTWAELRDISTPHLFNYPSAELFRVPGVRFHRHQTMHKLNLYLEHTIPARITDFVFELLGFPPVMDQVYQKVHRTIGALEHFTTNEWTYAGENMLLLDKATGESYRKWLTRTKKNTSIGDCGEQQFSYYQAAGVRPEYSSVDAVAGEHPFPMDLARLDWDQYFKCVILGIRTHLLREDEKTIPDARRTLFALKMIDFAVKAAVTGTGVYQILNSRSITRQILAAISRRSRQGVAQ